MNENIFHYLFYIKDNQITAINYSSDKYSILKIKGNNSIPFTENYWQIWREYSGICEGEKTDFCYIYDTEPQEDEKLINAQCDNKDCFWNRNRIEDAVRMLHISEPTEIRNYSNGALLVKAGSFRNVKENEIIKLKVWFTEIEEVTEEVTTATGEITPFIDHYINELKYYKEGYDHE